MLKKNVREMDEQVKETVKQSVEKERGDWCEKSLITSSELYKFQTMLENIQNKLNLEGEVNLEEMKSDLSLVRA